MLKDKSKWYKYVAVGTALILIYKIINNFSDILQYIKLALSAISPVIIGAIIAFFLFKPAKKLEILLIKIKFIKKYAKVISILLVYTIIIGSVVLGFKFLIPILIKNAEELISNIPIYYKNVNDYISKSEFLSNTDILEDFVNKTREFFTFSQLNKYISYISSIANSFLSFFLSLVLSLYILLEKNDIFAFVSRVKGKIFHAEKLVIFTSYTKRIVDLFYSYFIGLAIDSLTVGIISSVALSLFKIPYAPLLGLVIGLGNMVPFFGPIVSALIVYVVGAITIGPIQAIWVIVFQLILGQIDGNFIQPRILGNSTGISPLTVLVSVIVFGEIFGFIGMVFGVPIGATIKIFIDDFMDDGKVNAS